jgi:MATE family multidrug resistance protein
MTNRFEWLGTWQWHKRVWLLALPIILSNVTVPLVGAVDTAVMGRMDEPEYIGAVALGASIFSLLFWVFGFLRMGTSGFVAQSYGAGQPREIQRVLLRSLIIGVTIGVCIVALQKPLLHLCLQLFDGGERLDDLTETYYSIRIWSAPATLSMYVVLGTLIGLQRTGGVFLTQCFLNLLNVVLDIYLVTVLHWGISGVAIASVVSEYAALALALVLIRKPLLDALRNTNRHELFNTRALVKLATHNSNIFIRTLLLVLSFFFFNATSTTLGANTLAANAILIQLLHICAYALDGFAHSAETLAGSAWGKRSAPQYHQAIAASSLQSLAIAALMSGILYLYGSSAVALFTTQSPVLQTADNYLPWLIVLPIISVWCYQLDGIFIGTTHTAEMRNAMIISAVCFYAAATVLVPQLGNHGLWLAFTTFMLCRAVTLLFYLPRISRSIGSHAD